MKSQKYFILIYLFVFLFISCEKDDDLIIEPADVTIEINNDNINGQWHLSLINDESLNSEFSYFHLNINSTDTIFNIKENLNSSFETISTGTYSLFNDKENNVMISGIYDYSFGESWSETYIIEYLTQNNMVWKGLSSDDILVFEKQND